MKKLGLIVVIFIVAIGVSQQSLFERGLPFTHDSQNHLARFANYYLAVRQGQLPPRVAPGLNNVFGYPVFNFNYPLANMLAVPLIVMNVSVQHTLEIQLLVTMLVSMGAVFWWLRPYFGKWPSMVAGVMYGLSPYALSLIYVRGVIGESWAYALLPLMLGLIDRSLMKKEWVNWYQIGLVVVGAALLLSHNIVAMLVSVPLMVYVGYKVRRGWRDVKYLVLPLFLTLMLSLFFWLPALVEKSWTNLDGVSLSSQVTQHVLQPGQLFWARAWNGFSRLGPVDGMSFGLGLGAWVVVGVASIVWMKNRLRPRFVGVILGLFFGLLFLMSALSREIWDVVPLLNYVQFPWRVGILVPLLLSVLLAWLLNSYNNKWLIGLALVLVVIGAGNLSRSQSQFYQPDEYWFGFSETSSILDENMPVWFDKFTNYELTGNEFANKPLFVAGEAEVSQESFAGSQHRYVIDADESVLVMHRLAYLPGWKVWVDGEEVEIEYERPEYPGLITYQLSPGEYEVEVLLTQRTWPRMVGNAISFFGLILLVFIVVAQIRKVRSG